MPGSKASAGISSEDRRFALGHAGTAAWLEQAAKTGLAVQTTVSFNSMLFHGDTPTGLHPRRARGFSLLRQAGADSQRAPAPARSGSPGRMQLLGAKVGARGRQHPADGGGELGRAGSGFSPSRWRQGPDPQRRYRGDRGPAYSRQQWRYLVKGPRAMRRLERWSAPKLGAGQKLVKPRRSGPAGQNGQCRASSVWHPREFSACCSAPLWG